MNATEYGQLLIFQTIAREGSISACARKLRISVPAVSKSLRQLENRLGVLLFQRSTRKIQLTEAGIQLFKQTVQAVENLSQAFENTKTLAQTPIGTVRITLSQVAFSLILKPVYAEFHARFPNIVLDISIDNAIVNLVDENIDLGIRFGHNVNKGMVARKLTGEIYEGLFISRQYAQQYGIPKTIDELKNHQLIGYRFISANRLHPLTLNDNGELKTVEMPFSLILNDSEMVIDATHQGFGIGRIFEPQYKHLENKANLLPILQAHWQTFQPLYLYYPPNAQKVKRVQVLIEFLLEKSKTLGN